MHTTESTDNRSLEIPSPRVYTSNDGSRDDFGDGIRKIKNARRILTTGMERASLDELRELAEMDPEVLQNIIYSVRMDIESSRKAK